MITICKLCSSNLDKAIVKDGKFNFCCHGCYVVFQVLSSKDQLLNFQENPIFIQAVKTGLISNTKLLDEIEINRPIYDESERLHLEIRDLWCPSCAELIKLILLKEKGIKNCVVDYATDVALIEFSPRYISKDKIKSIISKIGYQPFLFNENNKSIVSFSLYLRFLVAAFFSLNIMMFSYPLYATYFIEDVNNYGPLFAWLSLLCSIPVLAYSGWPIFSRAWNHVRSGILGMEALVFVGVFSAFGISLFELMNGGTRVYFDSMSAVISLVLLGKIVESKAKYSAKESLFLLNRSVPQKGRKQFENGEVKYVPVKDIIVGDLVVAGVGEKIVLDGVVVEGDACVDESLMTGEALSCTKTVGGLVLGGTMIQQGNIIFKVTSSKNETVLQNIIKMIEFDIGNKPTYLRPVDSILKWFVPLIFTIFIITLAFWFLFFESTHVAFLNALSVLLISCPCAIGIAAPLAESMLLQSFAEMGVIIRNRGCLQYLGNETTFILDKTGTLTEGNFKLENGLEGLSEKHRHILKGLALHSCHPLSKAIVNAIKDSAMLLTDIHEFPGKGIQGMYENILYKLGSSSFTHMLHSDEKDFFTHVYLTEDEKFICNLAFCDKIKVDAHHIVNSLYPAKSILLSGDTENAVMNVAQACNIPLYKCLMSPHLKRDFVEEHKKKGEIVAMLGDGINDAPALTKAHIGISVVNATDISIHVSDILLTTDRLNVIPKMRCLAIKGKEIVKQNLFWAFFYNIIGLCLAAFGFLTPLFAAFAMVVSSIIVTFNAQRIKKL